MHTVPSGLVLLAEWPGDALDAYLGGELGALTRRTITDPERLRKRLIDVREAGFAWGLGEFAEGIDSVAAPVRDARGNAIAAIHVHGPAYRFPRAGTETGVASAVVEAAARVSRLLV
jgi:DNA-binding IclR family transcriptional regulator